MGEPLHKTPAEIPVGTFGGVTEEKFKKFLQENIFKKLHKELWKESRENLWIFGENIRWWEFH